MNEIKAQKINRLKTFAENALNVGKAAALPTIAILGLNQLGAAENIKTAFPA